MKIQKGRLNQCEVFLRPDVTTAVWTRGTKAVNGGIMPFFRRATVVVVLHRVPVRRRLLVIPDGVGVVQGPQNFNPSRTAHRGFVRGFLPSAPPASPLPSSNSPLDESPVPGSGSLSPRAELDAAMSLVLLFELGNSEQSAASDGEKSWWPSVPSPSSKAPSVCFLLVRGGGRLRCLLALAEVFAVPSSPLVLLIRLAKLRRFIVWFILRLLQRENFGLGWGRHAAVVEYHGKEPVNGRGSNENTTTDAYNPKAKMHIPRPRRIRTNAEILGAEYIASGSFLFARGPRPSAFSENDPPRACNRVESANIARVFGEGERERAPRSTVEGVPGRREYNT